MDRKTGLIEALPGGEQTAALFSPFELQSPDLQLTADEIHVWFGMLDQPMPENDRFMRTLSSDERMKAGRYHKLNDSERFIARHGMLRMLLGCYLGVKASELRMHQGKYGKPALSDSFGNGTIHFNLSHSKKAALFVFSRNYELGVDLELIRDVAEMETIAERFFTVREKTFILAQSPDKRRAAFFYCWTRKEAYIKAIGQGLSWPLDSFDVVPVQGWGQAGSIDDEETCISQWSIKTLRLDREYAGALAVNGRNCTLRYFNLAANACDSPV